MPSTILATNELPQVTIAPDVKVRRHLHAFDAFEIRVRIPVKLVSEEALNLVTAKVTRRQADGMQNQQINAGVTGAGAEVG